MNKNVKTFYIKYEKDLSIVEKSLLNTFREKYFYHAVDDILNFSKLMDQNDLFPLLCSTVLYVQNNFAIDFFNIWIEDIYIIKESKHNKFFANDDSICDSFSYIVLKLRCIAKSPKKKPEPLW